MLDLLYPNLISVKDISYKTNFLKVGFLVIAPPFLVSQSIQRKQQL